MTPVIVASGLTKSYGPRLAVDDVSFAVQPNEVMGLLGPNGSGKSTILRILTGYLKPTSGTASVAGFDVVSHGLEARARLGYVPEDVPLYTHMRVGEFLVFMGRVRGVPESGLRQAVDRAIERLSLQKVRDLLIAKLSRGYRQRVAIAQALLGEPKLLVLDEPTNGLDPRQIIEVRGLIRDLSRELSVLVTSHILAEIEKVAHRVAILLDGRLLTVHALGSQQGGRLKIRLRGAAAGQVPARLAGLGGLRIAETLPAPGSYIIEHDCAAAEAIAALVTAGLELEEATPAGSGLEALFLRLTEGTAA
jgi:ABC-2 type transport system ATP-binding protein